MLIIVLQTKQINKAKYEDLNKTIKILKQNSSVPYNFYLMSNQNVL